VKRIIILTVQIVSVIEDGQPVNKLQITAVFRFAVVDAAMRVERPDIVKSFYVQAPWSEVEELQSGAVVERLHSVQVATNATQAQSRAALVTAWDAANTAFQAEQPGRFFGAYYDGTWHAAGS
jgi:hypothetical protein